ncbi:lactate/malate dehydrogenase family protein [Phycisphaerales bacterium AB-hyl4]|uniref:Lactate/malate dehydrogenase family protein n=1 Tax=Natronomicrosphaera hydrolytica TaxID=3242702 RepID=A0ABV4U846_9BACT
MKTAIIGGGGRVGSNAAYALQCAGLVREIVLNDVNADLAAGEALDLMQGSSLIADQTITAGDMSALADADVVCITAGSRRKPDESRLDLVNRNVSIFKGILDDLRAANLRRDAIIFVVSNPVDVLTRLAIEHLDWQPSKVIGLGTVLDTARFCSLIAQAKNYPATQVKALILGEHGDAMAPIWSSASVAGMALTKLLSVPEQNELFKRTQGSGAEVIRRKGGAGYAVGASIAEVIHSIALDRRRILPVSSRMTGQYGVREVCLSVPTVVGREGVLEAREIELWPKEVAGIQASGRALQDTWQKLG